MSSHGEKNIIIYIFNINTNPEKLETKYCFMKSLVMKCLLEREASSVEYLWKSSYFLPQTLSTLPYFVLSLYF